MDKLAAAFLTMKRVDFLPKDTKYLADYDEALPIGYGQTNSQPTTVRLMLTWLDPQPGEKILDVGSGSGWTSALLAYLVGPSGKIYAVEKVPELVKFGAENCRRMGVKNARFFEATNTFGLADFAPYDRILVSAGAAELPKELLRQLKTGGRLVIPINYSIHVIQKTGKDSYQDTEHPGFMFVPLL